ncbi:M1 family aminopeptidase [uncultured Pontibacter sp.]|uniref:ABC transporter permease/M1 family aminopeptidase n=1 Tax=uncultured Pontibacter sp. TaxID=453356 RepID=UPI0026131ACC|nr:M1 family aminopeptidase [uncultured Pontibacter sp.]
MKFWEMFRFELAYQLCRWSTWLYLLAGLGCTFLLVSDFMVSARGGDVNFNAPVMVAAAISFATLFGLLVVAGVAGNAATKDAQARMEALVYTSPISKATYLGGKFLAAFAIAVFYQGVVILGLMLLVFMPGVEASILGPFRLATYLEAYFFLALPNAFISTAILFSVAAQSRFAMASFMAGVVLFLSAFLIEEIIAGYYSKWELAKVLDYTGFTLLKALKNTTTPLKLNSELIGLAPLLLNRLFWLALALLALLFTYLRFRFAYVVSDNVWARIFHRKAIVFTPGPVTVVKMPASPQSFSATARLKQALYLSVHYFKSVILGWGGVFILAAAFIIGMILVEIIAGALDIPVVPTTGRVSSALNYLTFRIFVIALITAFAGQLIWEERDARLHDLTDSVPLPDWLLLLSKFLALTLLILATQAVLLATGMIIQLIKDYHYFEIGLYLRILFGLQLVDYLLFAVMGMVVHVLVNQKYVGHMVVFLAFLYTIYPAKLGLEHNLLVYGAGPDWSYTEMAGFNGSVNAWFWFKLYWAAWAILFAVIARICWVRGYETVFAWRYRLVGLRQTPILWKVTAAATLLIFTLGSFVFYNTNIRNSYYTTAEKLKLHAAYEQLYGQYRHKPQPTLTAVALNAAIYPELRKAKIEGRYILKNRTKTTIDTIHVATETEFDIPVLHFNRKAKRIHTDSKLGHSIFILAAPLQPEDSIQMNFELVVKEKGIKNSGTSSPVARNGSYFVKNEGMPAIGYQPSRELSNAQQRKLHQLPPRLAASSLYNAAARENMLGRERIRFEAVLSTDQSQTAIAPGVLQKQWLKDGRSYFHYKTDVPILNLYGLFSANYAVRTSSWRNVQLQMFYHPGHTLNLDRMEKSMKASLDYYTKLFGPYQHRQLRLVEYPSSGTGATAYAGTIAFTEGLGLLNAAADYRDFDMPFAVVAHEVAHQWWGHQVVPANAEGAALLAESLAWYNGLGVVEAVHGKEHLWRLLTVMRESYLTPRSKADVPLLRANDYFLGYRKGPFAMYALREYVGPERLNVALRNFSEKHSGGKPPLPTSLDLYRELQLVTPDSLQYLLSDLLEQNTFWEIETKDATAKPLENGNWRLTLDAQLRKVRVDTAGVETEVAMHEWVEIGVFEQGKYGGEGRLMYLQKHLVSSGRQKVSVTVPVKPAMAGIDPRYLLIDADMNNNIKPVKYLTASEARQQKDIARR